MEKESLVQLVDFLSEPWTGLPVAAAAWATVYGVFCLLPGLRTRPFGFVSRAVAIVHALLAIVMVVPLMILDDGMRIGRPNTKAQLIVLSISGGFFTYDTVAWLWNGIARNKMDWAQIAHHTAVLVSLACTFHLRRSATDCVLGLFVAEMANPFMYMRYLLRALGMAETPIGKLNQRIFMATLTVTVPIIGPVLAYHIVTSPNSHMFHRVSVTGLVALNLYWFVLFSQKFMGHDSSAKKRTPIGEQTERYRVIRGGV